MLRRYFMAESADLVAGVLRGCHVRCETHRRSRPIREEPFVERTYLVLVAEGDRELAERVIRSQL